MNMPQHIEFLNLMTISSSQIRVARTTASQTNRRIIDVLEEEFGLGAEGFITALGSTLHYPTFDLNELNRLTSSFDVMPFAEATKRQCLPILKDGKLILVMGDPFDANLQAWAELCIPGNDFIWGLAHRADVAAYLASHEETLHAMHSINFDLATTETLEAGIETLSIMSIGKEIRQVVKLVNSTLYDALNCSASDIHFETNQSGLRISYRIDGVLTDISSIAGVELAEQAVSRIKIMAELDISEQRVPQDGRFKVLLQGREVDFRVSILPSIFGEDVVLRILDKRSLGDAVNGLSLPSLGFDDLAVAQLRQLAKAPYGMLLITGPTGSGKTTTLYALMSELNDGLDKIITIEDPIEYRLPSIVQIPVNVKKGLTFSRGLKSILRHDPDKIMIGEIRDEETAHIAIQSALSGHQVFSTVHANNTTDVIGRFLHMGVDPYTFVSAMNGIVAQRLIRVNCKHCSVEINPDTQLLAVSGIKKEDAASMNFRAGRGCRECRGTGFNGRKTIAEILCLNERIRELIVARYPIRLIREAARRNGTHFLRKSAVEMVGRGETTLTEINRVTFV